MSLNIIDADPAVFVTLKDGPTVNLKAIELAIDLEFRGHRLSVTYALGLRVTGSARLTGSDVSAIERHRYDLVQIARYEPPIV